MGMSGQPDTAGDVYSEKEYHAHWVEAGLKYEGGLIRFAST